MYKSFFIFITSVVLGSQLMAFVQSEHCGVETSKEKKLYSSEFHWNYSLPEMLEKYKEIYNSEKRLSLRAFVDDRGRIVMPYSTVSSGIYNVALPKNFILSIRKHIEESLKLGYVNAIFFPDMGHSHYFIPHDVYKEISQPGQLQHLFYEELFKRPELKVFYHTAEQLQFFDENKKLLDDRDVQWRFFTRNLVGDNQVLGRMELLHARRNSHNTGREYSKKYRYWGAGFSLSASKNGCFLFKHEGKSFFFDLSFYDLTPGPTN